MPSGRVACSSCPCCSHCSTGCPLLLLLPPPAASCWTEPSAAAGRWPSVGKGGPDIDCCSAPVSSGSCWLWPSGCPCPATGCIDNRTLCRHGDVFAALVEQCRVCQHRGNPLRSSACVIRSLTGRHEMCAWHTSPVLKCSCLMPNKLPAGLLTATLRTWSSLCRRIPLLAATGRLHALQARLIRLSTEVPQHPLRHQAEDLLENIVLACRHSHTLRISADVAAGTVNHSRSVRAATNLMHSSKSGATLIAVLRRHPHAPHTSCSWLCLRPGCEAHPCGEPTCCRVCAGGEQHLNHTHEQRRLQTPQHRELVLAKLFIAGL